MKRLLVASLSLLAAWATSTPALSGPPATTAGAGFTMVPQTLPSEAALAAAFHPGGKLFATGGKDRTVRLWNLQGMLISTFTGATDWISAIAFSPDGKTLAGAQFRHEIRIWRIDGTHLATIKLEKYDKVMSLAFSPDGSRLAGVMDNSTASITTWLLDGKQIGKKPLPLKAKIRRFTADGMSLYETALAQDGGEVEVLIQDLEWEKSGPVPKAAGRRLAGLEGRTKILAISADRRRVMSAQQDDIHFGTAGAGVGAAPVKIAWTGKAVGGRSVSDLVFSPDGRMVVSTGEDEMIRLWDFSGMPVLEINCRNEPVLGAAFSPDGRRILALTRRDRLNVTLDVWGDDLRYESSIALETAKAGSISLSGAVRADGKRAALGDLSGRVAVFDLDTGKLLEVVDAARHLPHTGGIEGIAFGWGNDSFAATDGIHGVFAVPGTYSPFMLTPFNDASGAASAHAFGPRGVVAVAFGEAIETIDTSDESAAEQRRTQRANRIEAGLLALQKANHRDITSLAYSPDGALLAAGFYDGAIEIRKADGRSVVMRLAGHQDRVKSVAWSPDGRLLVSASNDATLRIWNVATGAAAVLLRDGVDWLAYTPDGYFDSSRHGGRLVAMVRGLEAFGVDQFALKNNRPDLILDALGLGTAEMKAHLRAQHLRRLARHGVNEKDLGGEMHVPSAKISDVKKDGARAALSIEIRDDAYRVARYNVYVNDVPVLGAYGKPAPAGASRVEETIELSPGLNKIEATCINDKGAESYRAMAVVEHGAKPAGDLYFVGFGVSRYQDPDLALMYADKDAIDLGALMNRMKGRFMDVHVRLFLNEDVTAGALAQAKALLAKAAVNDTVVLFIAGHGLHGAGPEAIYYYLTHGARLNDLPGTAMTFEAIESLLDGIRPRQKLFLMDTCESGELDGAVQRDYFALAKEKGFAARAVRGIGVKDTAGKPRAGRSYLAETDRFIHNDLLRRTGAIVFSASKGGEFSYESRAVKNGFFTSSILAAFADGSADADKDGFLSTEELRAFVAKAVAAMTFDRQHPVIDRDNIYVKLRLPLPK